jgi:uncharacterized protein (UPF0333 family)
MIESNEYLKSDLNLAIISNDAKSNHISDNTDPISKSLKVWFLIIICISGIGSYFCYDNPSALEKKIIEVENI